jgi:DNA-binding MarR family transcriptional regulator
MPNTNTITSPETMSPAAAKVLELLCAERGATVRQLAERGSLGRSTVGKVLTALEARRLARREPGEHTGHKVAPDLWLAAEPTSLTTSKPAAGQPLPQNVPSADDGDGGEPGRAVGTDEPALPDDGKVEIAAPHGEFARREPATPLAKTAGQVDGRESANGDASAASQDATSGASSEILTPNLDGANRLAKGALRQMALDHLHTHPAEIFTPSRLSRELNRSSGAIANALDVLVKQGLAELITEKPRAFRLRTVS